MDSLQHHHTTPHKRRLCQLCRNHGKIRPTRGHKRQCPHSDCRCDKCMVTLENRRANATQVANRRQEARAKKLEAAKSDSLTSKNQTPQFNPSVQADYSIMDQHYARNTPGVIRQWLSVNPSLQQQTLSPPASYYMYNYLSPYCFWMDQTNQISPSIQAVTQMEQFQAYSPRNPAAYLCSVQQNALGGSYQFAICQPEYQGQSAVSQPAVLPSAVSPSAVLPSAVSLSAVSQSEEDSSPKAEEQQILIPDTKSVDSEVDREVTSVCLSNSKKNGKLSFDKPELKMTTTTIPTSTAGVQSYSISALLKTTSSEDP